MLLAEHRPLGVETSLESFEVSYGLGSVSMHRYFSIETFGTLMHLRVQFLLHIRVSKSFDALDFEFRSFDNSDLSKLSDP